MLVAISGSQGSGKSTVLSELKNRGHNIIERKTSRSILADWDVTLSEVNNNHDLTIRFQDEIIQRKFDDEAEAAMSDELWFTERTYADLFTYTLVSLGKDNEYGEWLDNYYEQCAQFQETYDRVFYLGAGQFGVQHDGVRGSNKHYSRMVDLVMNDYTEDMTDNEKLSLILDSSVEGRVKSIIMLTAIDLL